MVVTDGDLQVFDTAGVEKTVNFPEGATYLSTVGSATAAESFALVSIADYTFVVNKNVAVRLSGHDRP